MKIKRQKNFTIQEGHYTGPKDQDKVPGVVEVFGKSALGGAVIGGVAGEIGKKIDKESKNSILGGTWSGAKYGGLGGIILKFFINYFHNPMSSVKYQEVDKNIRREFGIYRAATITVGDKLDNRAKLDDKFRFNDRNISDFKVNITIQNNQLTMYTLGITDQELEKFNDTLDYYCKKFTGMNYSSRLINQRTNSYAVDITFTNYQAISNFIMEISGIIGTKINLLDNKALVENKLKRELDTEEKTFSVKPINKYDVIELISKNTVSRKTLMAGPKSTLEHLVTGMITETVKKLSNNELAKTLGNKIPKCILGNDYLEDALKRNHSYEGFGYTIGNKKSRNNISMNQGLLIITTGKDTPDGKKIDSDFYRTVSNKVNKSEISKVITYTYSVQSRHELDMILKRLIATGVTFNIFEG